MADQSTQQRLAAVLAADVVGYTRLLEKDTEGTVASWQSARDEIITPTVSNHSGRIVKLTGDGFLAEFPTIHQAVNCGIAMQQGFAASNLEFRIGINLGDIIDDGQDIHGEGINVASRIEALADPGGICISGEAHVMVRNRVDVPYRDMGEHEVKHVSHPVRVYAIDLGKANDPSVTVEQFVADKPSIAVLPFDNLSGDPEQEYFSDGITEDIITALSRIRQFFVIARNTTFTYKGQSVDVQAVASELGVRYVLEGSVRKAGNRVRITAQLIDGEKGNHIWAQKYDRELEDIFAVQDDITLTIVGALQPELSRAEWERARNIPSDNLDAWTTLQKAISFFYETGKDPLNEAIKLAERATQLDPNFSLAHAWGAAMLARRRIFGYSEFDHDQAYSMAQRALELHAEEPMAHYALGYCHYAVGQFDTALEEFEEALRLNPNHEQVMLVTGRTLVLMGRHEEAISCYESVIKTTPRDPLIGNYFAAISLAYLCLRDYEQSISWASKAVRYPRAIHAPAFLLSAFGHTGRTDEARAALSQLRRVQPDHSISFLRETFLNVNDEDMDHFLDGLRKGGLAEV